MADLLKLIARYGPEALPILKAACHLIGNPDLRAAFADLKGRKPTDPAALADYEKIIADVAAEFPAPAAG